MHSYVKREIESPYYWAARTTEEYSQSSTQIDRKITKNTEEPTDKSKAEPTEVPNSEETILEDTDSEVFPPGDDGSGSDLTDVPETTSTSERNHGTKTENFVKGKETPHLACISVDHTIVY